MFLRIIPHLRNCSHFALAFLTLLLAFVLPLFLLLLFLHLPLLFCLVFLLLGLQLRGDDFRYFSPGLVNVPLAVEALDCPNDTVFLLKRERHFRCGANNFRLAKRHKALA